MLATNEAAFAFIGAVTLVLALGAWFAIASLRRQSYRAWPPLARWAFLAVVAGLVSLGAAGLAYNYMQKWGLAAALWLLTAPLVYGIWRSATGPRA